MAATNQIISIVPPTPEIAEKIELKPTKAKKIQNEAQKAGLLKAMEALKTKREAIAKVKEDNILKGLPPPPKETRVKKVENYREAIAPKVRKERTVYTTPLVKRESIFSDSEYMQLKELLSKDKNPTVEIIKEVVKEVPIEKVVHKERVLTGSELLNRIFF